MAVVSDVHAGSVLAPCPPEGVVLDDGGRYEPSAVQRWLWDCWAHYWQRVARTVAAAQADLWVVVNGDAVEGEHHGTTQIISAHPEPQAYVCERVFGVPLALRPAQLFVVRGTEAHTGPSAATEEALARTLGATKSPDGRWSWWHLVLAPHGVRMDFAHHPSIGGHLPWTQPQAVQRLAFLIWTHHTVRGLAAPALAVRSHRHVTGDSYDAYPTRAVITPAWQIKTAYAHRVAADSIADIGGVVVTVQVSGAWSLERCLYPVHPPTPWTPETP